MLPAIVLALAAAAPAPDSAGDIRCLVATSLLAGSHDKAAAQIGYFTAMFWLGQLGDMAVSKVDARMTEQALHMTATDVSLEMQRCGAIMKERGDMLSRVGASLSAKAERLDTR